MPCNSEPPPSSPHALFLQAAFDFAILTPSDDIPAAFANLHSLLFDVLSNANDPNAYALSFTTLVKFGLPDLMEFEVTGNIDALSRLKQKVQASLENLP